ncbi:hypothetical protein N7563_22015 [Leclercia adecarboxylata ATCC 23216 = NBRC 102595]|nr:hypothetical protein [Leclercia adecarboxylata ATCC 23216 = NBRC 102595]
MNEKDTVIDNAIVAIIGIISQGGNWEDVKADDDVSAAVDQGFDLEYIKNAWM